MAQTIKVTLLPDTVTPVRDPLFTTVDEATRVAENIRTFAPPTVPEVVEVSINDIGGTPNRYNDGRLPLMLKFTRSMMVTSPETRIATEKDVPFCVNAGLLLDDLNNKPDAPWKFIAEFQGFDGTFDLWTGDVEK